MGLFVNSEPPLAFPQFLSNADLFRSKPYPRPSPSERLHGPHRFALGHMDLNVFRKSPIFLGQGANDFLRNRPYEASMKGLARG